MSGNIPVASRKLFLLSIFLFASADFCSLFHSSSLATHTEFSLTRTRRSTRPIVSDNDSDDDEGKGEDDLFGIDEEEEEEEEDVEEEDGTVILVTDVERIRPMDKYSSSRSF
jgi:hypothetical protein